MSALTEQVPLPCKLHAWGRTRRLEPVCLEKEKALLETWIIWYCRCWGC